MKTVGKNTGSFSFKYFNMIQVKKVLHNVINSSCKKEKDEIYIFLNYIQIEPKGNVRYIGKEKAIQCINETIINLYDE